MRPTSTFTASIAPVTATSPAGGSVAVANPAAGTGATALLIQNPGSNALLRWGAASFAPAPIPNGFEDLALNPGGQILLTDPVRLAATTILVSGSVTLTPGSVSQSITVNS